MPLALQSADEAAKAAEEAANAAAEAAAAAGDEWQMTERECTAEEVATQKKDWDEQQAASKKRDEEQKKMAQMMLGGIDPERPQDDHSLYQGSRADGGVAQGRAYRQRRFPD